MAFGFPWEDVTDPRRDRSLSHIPYPGTTGLPAFPESDVVVCRRLLHDPIISLNRSPFRHKSVRFPTAGLGRPFVVIRIHFPQRATSEQGRGAIIALEDATPATSSTLRWILELARHGYLDLVT